MIGKILKGRSFKGCISYVMDAKDAKLLACEGVLETGVRQNSLSANILIISDSLFD
jgi:hypothetical protein